ncbi:hypothetical protein M422DRAFT_244143 [Sphaerobolus stellatus SS14]|nr:hypothetical protein M422DRAFT_244143 [Sphaerobolus stellatus SS14]
MRRKGEPSHPILTIPTSDPTIFLNAVASTNATPCNAGTIHINKAKNDEQREKLHIRNGVELGIMIFNVLLFTASVLLDEGAPQSVAALLVGGVVGGGGGLVWRRGSGCCHGEKGGYRGTERVGALKAVVEAARSMGEEVQQRAERSPQGRVAVVVDESATRAGDPTAWRSGADTAEIARGGTNRSCDYADPVLIQEYKSRYNGLLCASLSASDPYPHVAALPYLISSLSILLYPSAGDGLRAGTVVYRLADELGRFPSIVRQSVKLTERAANTRDTHSF